MLALPRLADEHRQHAPRALRARLTRHFAFARRVLRKQRAPSAGLEHEPPRRVDAVLKVVDVAVVAAARRGAARRRGRREVVRRARGLRLRLRLGRAHEAAAAAQRLRAVEVDGVPRGEVLDGDVDVEDAREAAPLQAREAPAGRAERHRGARRGCRGRARCSARRAAGAPDRRRARG